MHRISFSTIVLIMVLIAAGNAQNPEWIVYDTSNSGLPNNYVSAIGIESNGTKWLASGQLTSFDGTDWTVHDWSNSALSYAHSYTLAIDVDGTKWMDISRIMSEGRIGDGLMSFDGIDWTVYDMANSGLPYNGIQAIAVDNEGMKWIGTGDICGNGTGCESGGLVSFDGSSWTVYDTSNTDLPDNHIGTIAIEENGTKWIGVSAEVDLGHHGYGLVSFDGNTWTVYDTSTSDIPGNYVSTIAIEDNGIKWIGFLDDIPFFSPDGSPGMASFDGTNWTVYDTSNSGLPSNYVRSIAVDDNGVKWVGSWNWHGGGGIGGGLASFDGTNWIVYNTSNSGLPSNYVNTITIDASGNKWIGTSDGLAVFNEGGIVGIYDESQLSSHPIGFILTQNYPNPFNPTTTISYDVPEQTSVMLTVFDIRGHEVMTMLDEVKPPGNYEVQWNGMDQTGNQVSTGVYFCRLQAGDYSQVIKMLYLK